MKVRHAVSQPLLYVDFALHDLSVAQSGGLYGRYCYTWTQRTVIESASGRGLIFLCCLINLSRQVSELLPTSRPRVSKEIFDSCQLHYQLYSDFNCRFIQIT